MPVPRSVSLKKHTRKKDPIDDLEASHDDGIELEDRGKPWMQYPVGYPRFAAFIANDEDKSTTIFRRFKRLSARNLLCMESELADLEAEQDRFDIERKHDPDLSLSMKSWNYLCLLATDTEEMGDSEREKQRLTIQIAAQERSHIAWRIREVLKMYRELYRSLIPNITNEHIWMNP